MGTRTPPIRISPSLLSADFARLGEDVRRAEDAGCDWLHVDVMDGHFVPNLTIGAPVVAALKRVARVPLDVHVMISEPVRYAPDFQRAGAHVLTFHYEVTGPEHTAAAIARLKELGIPKVGIAINPDAPVEPLEPFLADLDLVLVMSVFAGFGGQKFLPDVLEKVRWLRRTGFDRDVQMDGGINRETLPLCVEAGANVLVSGSALFGAPELAAEIRHYRELAQMAGGNIRS
ncbi:MAG: ribulose-phosphate 3-epimerase [Planctomycetaceae bacterium]|nr:ribulose-phosphate 3-epimerase [Planctomycetaceae bacterium]